MFTKKATLALLGSVVAFTSGCIQYRYGNERVCLQLAEAADVDAPTRAKVHVFLMDGLASPAGMEQLESAIVKTGFPKVYVAQRVDRAWFYTEIHRLHRDSSSHRYVLVAQGAACREMQRLADDLVQDGISLDGLIFLDPIGQPVDSCDTPGYPVRVIRGYQSFGMPRVQATDSVQVANVGRSSLPKDPSAQAAVIDWLWAAARSIPQKQKLVDCVPQLEEKPVPRPQQSKVTPPAEGRWADLMCPIIGHN